MTSQLFPKTSLLPFRPTHGMVTLDLHTLYREERSRWSPLKIAYPKYSWEKDTPLRDAILKAVPEKGFLQVCVYNTHKQVCVPGWMIMAHIGWFGVW